MYREEKDVSSKGRAQMKDKLTSSVRILDGGAALTIKNVSKCEGEGASDAGVRVTRSGLVSHTLLAVRQLMVRGQKRVGYELNVSAQWVLVDAAGSSVAAGSLRLDEITDTDSDIIGGIAATCTSCTGAASNPDGWRDASSCVSTMKRGMLPWLRDIVREWVEEMKRQ